MGSSHDARHTVGSGHGDHSDRVGCAGRVYHMVLSRIARVLDVVRENARLRADLERERARADGLSVKCDRLLDSLRVLGGRIRTLKRERDRAITALSCYRHTQIKAPDLHGPSTTEHEGSD